MDNLFVSQVLSVSAGQQEVDKATHVQNRSADLKVSSEEAFKSYISTSLKEVNEALETEQQDPLARENEEDEEENKE